MVVRISRALLTHITELAAASPEEEVCGVLIAMRSGDGSDVIEKIAPVANIAVDPATRFEMDPTHLIRMNREARLRGEALIGHYHSHPKGLAVPSLRDADMAYGDGAVWLICTPGGDYAAWRAVDGGEVHGRFRREEMCVE